MMGSKIHFPGMCSMFTRNKHISSINYQYWQQSVIPTMHFQKSLPRLPIPKLNDTCNRYLAAQQPLLSPNAFKKTEQLVKQFKNSIGIELQQALIARDKANSHTSYVSEPWFDKYLKDRTPLPINYNPVLVFHNETKPGYNEQLIRTTNLIISSLRFYKSLKEEVLEPEVYHMNPRKSDTRAFRKVCSKVPSSISWYVSYLLYNAYPLDMSQYQNLFNTTRIPELEKDRIYQREGRHVTVQRNGNFYIVEVLDQSNNILSADVIMGRIKAILDDRIPNAQFPLGVLTTLDRDEWSCLRHHLQVIGNTQGIDTIDSALFNVCLDDKPVGDDSVNLGHIFLHGDGRNRWFDKSLSLVVTKDGKAGVNFEHSWGDGVAVLRFFEDIYKDSTNNPQVHPDSKPISENIQRLEFKLDDKMKTAISTADKNYASLCKSLDIDILEMNGLGKQMCKKHTLSPDAIMQLGFQAAHYKLKGQFVSSYESCSTAAYKHGRTETVRPCTMPVKDYCLATKKTPSELKEMLSVSSKKHSQLVKEAVMGQGFDRHLFVLNELAKKMSKNDCGIFEDHSYADLHYNVISTSTLSSPAVWAGAFGPVVRDGFGIAYSIQDDYLGVLVTTYNSQANGKDFVEALKQSYEEILSTLQANK